MCLQDLCALVTWTSLHDVSRGAETMAPTTAAPLNSGKGWSSWCTTLAFGGGLHAQPHFKVRMKIRNVAEKLGFKDAKSPLSLVLFSTDVLLTSTIVDLQFCEYTTYLCPSGKNRLAANCNYPRWEVYVCECAPWLNSWCEPRCAFPHINDLG